MDSFISGGVGGLTTAQAYLSGLVYGMGSKNLPIILILIISFAKYIYIYIFYLRMGLLGRV